MVDVQSAASLAAGKGVMAETQYDVARASAKKTYLTSVANAELAKTTTIADAELTFLLAAPWNYETSGWLSTSEGQSALATKNGLIAGAQTTYDAAVKTAKETHAGQIAVAQVARVWALGEALIVEAEQAAAAEIDYVIAQNADELAYEQMVTSVTAAAVQALASSAMAYANAATGNMASLIVGLGAAAVSLATDMKPVNVTHTGSMATHEGQYHANQADDAADQMAEFAGATAGLSSSEIQQRNFLAAQSQAEADWTSGMAGPFTTYATAMATAEADEIIALTEAGAQADSAFASADQGRIGSLGSLRVQVAIDTAAAWRTQRLAEREAWNAYHLGLALAKQGRDSAYATSTQTRAVANTTADGNMYVALAQLPAGGNATSILHMRDVARADAEVAQITSRGDADQGWTETVAALQQTFKQAYLESKRAQALEEIRIDRNFKIDCAPITKTHAQAYAAAFVDYRTAELAAILARSNSEAIALADFRSADYTQAVPAVAAIDAAIDVPWTAYQAELAVTKRDWWINAERGNFLQWVTEFNAAYSTYNVELLSQFLAHATQTAEHDRVYETTLAQVRYNWHASDVNAAADRRLELAAVEAPWQIAQATARRDWEVQMAVASRNYVDTGDESALELATANARPVPK